MSEQRLTSAEIQTYDEEMETSLRPKTFSDFVGQKTVTDNLKVYTEAAKLRGEPLDHVLFYGPPGLGKTTLAGVIAKELGTELYVTSGPALQSPLDLAQILSRLNTGDVLFIDEIHRMNRTVEEILYSAMEDFTLHLVQGKGMGANMIDVHMGHFTLIGATTRAGSLSAPLRDRFGILSKFELYGEDDLRRILARSADILEVDIDDVSLGELARRSRGTPRIANRLLRRVRDFSQVIGTGAIDRDITEKTLRALGIDSIGLEQLDRDILLTLIRRFRGGPAGIDAIAASVGEERVTIEDAYEPYLVQQGLLLRTPRGRQVTSEAYEHLGLPVPEER